MSPFSSLRTRLAGRSAATAASGFTETSVALMLSPGPCGFEALFIRRAICASDPWSGQIGLPGGRREPGDADLLMTAVRETSEEIGVDLPPEALLGTLDDVQPSAPSLPPLMIRPFVFGVDPRPESRTSAEVASSHWIALETLLGARGMTEVVIRAKTLQAPCFKVRVETGELIIWGLTYRILNGLMLLLS